MSQVDWKRPLILAVVLVILGFGAYWLEYSYTPQKEEKEKASKQPFQIKDRQIARIRVTSGDGSVEFV